MTINFAKISLKSAINPCFVVDTSEHWKMAMWNHCTFDIAYEKKVVSDVRLTNAVVNQQLKTLKVRVN